MPSRHHLDPDCLDSCRHSGTHAEWLARAREYGRAEWTRLSPEEKRAKAEYVAEWRRQNPESIAESRRREREKRRERMANDPEYAARQKELARARSARRPYVPTSCVSCHRPKDRPRARYCDSCLAARKPPPKDRTPKPRQCRDCAMVFQPTGTHAFYCDECRARHEKAWRKHQRNLPHNRVKRAAKFRERYATDPKFKARVNARGKRHEYRKRGAREGSLYRSQDIYERDGWMCHLCGKPVNRLRKWPDKMCASIDHLIPLSQGGPDSPDNVALAHWLCNVARGDRGIAQLRLIA